MHEDTISQIKLQTSKPEMPEFELADIMGDFEIDDLGNFVLIRAAGNSDCLINEVAK